MLASSDSRALCRHSRKKNKKHLSSQRDPMRTFTEDAGIWSYRLIVEGKKTSSLYFFNTELHKTLTRPENPSIRLEQQSTGRKPCIQLEKKTHTHKLSLPTARKLHVKSEITSSTIIQAHKKKYILCEVESLVQVEKLSTAR